MKYSSYCYHVLIIFLLLLSPLMAYAADHEKELTDSFNTLEDSLSEYIPGAKALDEDGILIVDILAATIYGTTITTTVPTGSGGSGQNIDRYMSGESLGAMDRGFAAVFTGVLIPFGFILGFVGVCLYAGLKNRAVILGIVVFIMMGLSWIGIWPSWINFVFIFIAAGILAYIFSKSIAGGVD